VALFRGIDDPDPSRTDPLTQAGTAHEELRRTARSGWLGTGTLACGRCDAPVVLAGGPVAPTDALSCPFCDHRAPVRDFLSLAAPPRPARVDVRVVPRHPPRPLRAAQPLT
jgi:hypothetical protein